MNHRVRPEANSNSKPDFGSVNFTCLRVRQFIGDMELLMYQQQQRVAELEEKHKLCKCKHDTQATAHLVEKVAYLEEQLKSKKDEQLRMRRIVSSFSRQLFWIKPNLKVLKNVKRWGMVGFCS